MLKIGHIRFRLYEFELECLRDQLRRWDKWRIEIMVIDNNPDQIEFTNDWVAILTREEDLPFWFIVWQ